MIEILEIFWSSPIELRVIILGAIVSDAYFSWQDYKRKQQERLNKMGLDNRD